MRFEFDENNFSGAIPFNWTKEAAERANKILGTYLISLPSVFLIKTQDDRYYTSVSSHSDYIATLFNIEKITELPCKHVPVQNMFKFDGSDTPWKCFNCGCALEAPVWREKK